MISPDNTWLETLVYSTKSNCQVTWYESLCCSQVKGLLGANGFKHNVHKQHSTSE